MGKQITITTGSDHAGVNQMLKWFKKKPHTYRVTRGTTVLTFSDMADAAAWIVANWKGGMVTLQTINHEGKTISVATYE
jgi:hypothetical protein